MGRKKTRERGQDRTDDFGEGAVVALDVSGDALGFDEGGAEEDERVGGPRDMARVAFLCVGGFGKSGARGGVGGGGGDARRILLGYEFEARSRLHEHVVGAQRRVRAVRDGCEIGVE